MTNHSSTRRMRLAATALGAIAVLAACSSDSKTTASSSSSGSSTSSSSPASSGSANSSSSGTALDVGYCTKVAHLFDDSPDTEGKSPEEIKAAYAAYQTGSAADFTAIEKGAPADAKAAATDLKAALAAIVATGDENDPAGEIAYAKLVGASTSGCGWTAQAITAQDYSYSGVPKELKAGTYVIALKNAGKEPHLFTVGRVKDGVTKTLDEILAESTDGPPPDLEDVPGAAFAPPGAEGTGVIELTKPGRYIYICPIRSPDAILHLVKGMKGEVTVK
ncbi:MAG: hypothetical protein ABIV94_06920 [Acidimicrobiales bacterium]